MFIMNREVEIGLLKKNCILFCGGKMYIKESKDLYKKILNNKDNKNNNQLEKNYKLVFVKKTNGDIAFIRKKN